MSTHVLLLLLLLRTLPSEIDTLILKSGERIEIEGSVTIEDNTAIFRLANGTLVSMPSDEIDLEGTASVNTETPARGKMPGTERKRLRVTDEEKRRLLSELEKSKAPRSVSRQSLPAVLPKTTDSNVEVEGESDELYWRRASRELQENLRQAKEKLDLLTVRERRLQDELLSLRAAGYDTRDFSYVVFELQDTRDAMDQAGLDIQRAKRELAQFQQDAQREGILPGWLR